METLYVDFFYIYIEIFLELCETRVVSMIGVGLYCHTPNNLDILENVGAIITILRKRSRDSYIRNSIPIAVDQMFVHMLKSKFIC